MCRILFARQVIPRGFEPRTHSLEGCCSIQLSYETSMRKTWFFSNAGAKVLYFFEMCKFFLL